MLLTSSQVSIAISSGIIITFTIALFLSGYVIQQRTLRDLRRAIRPDPRPSPKIYLPDRFRETTTELEDGRVVGLNEGDGSQKDTVVEIRPSVPDEGGQKVMADERRKDDGTGKNGKGGEEKKEQDEKPESRAERRRRIKKEIQELSQGETPMYYQRRLW
ncbi:uncharacterized protein BCR38DRAFT_338034 [Pseudomassariella vexata]|uniref:Uncharacterized protein n=1 Tax=Pseudomassariella vexata TaxID=1141098 RepID=A0A1Y2E8I8_9PEZI|nr:uncharacterized protein BCR38DRAFT_338034 [Pseudomassariella vexata]ORY67634.1 hypothetical protein BCR38DRAFT_338034 [Pseudomassariella vexata]